MTFVDSFNDPQVFQDNSELIVFAADKLLSRADKDKVYCRAKGDYVLFLTHCFRSIPS